MNRTSPLIRLSLWASLGLVSLGVAACGGGDEEPKPAGSTSEIALRFGAVSIQTERVLSFELKSSGDAALVVSEITPQGTGANRYRVVDDDGLKAAKAGLAAGKSATIKVAYRPCPGAWTDTGLNPKYDFNKCELNAVDNGELKFVANAALTPVAVSGEPGVTPEKTTVSCLAGTGHCGKGDLAKGPLAKNCSILNFGEVTAGSGACELALDLENPKSDAATVAALLVEHAEVLVQKDSVNVSAADAGFELLDAEKSPLKFPLRVEPEAKTRIWVRFTAKKDGSLVGNASSKMGLRLFTNAKDAPRAISVVATGIAPQLQVNPAAVNFGSDVKVGEKKTVKVSLHNGGGAVLTISDISLSPAGEEFTMGAVSTPADVAVGAKQEVEITYAPTDGGQDVAKLVVKSNDPSTSTLEIPIRGGPVPDIDVSPPISLEFPGDDAEGTIQISNNGYGDLKVTELTLTDASDGGSVDDFFIEGCAALPCDPKIELCPAHDAACTKSQTELKVTYRNNDLSTVDFVNLTMKSNDPANPEYKLLLSAKSNPCLYPQPTVTVDGKACKGKPVKLVVAGNVGGPKGSTDTTIKKYEWSWLRYQGAVPVEAPPGSGNFTFTAPEKTGLLFLRLKATNSCGAQNQSYVVTRIGVEECVE